MLFRSDELKRLEACPRAVKLLNIPRLRELLRNWDTEKDWAKKTIDYRGYLLDALSVGHFVRRADEMHA